MRRRRFLWPLLILATAAVLYVTLGPDAEAPRPVARPPRVDLNRPGMELRAGPPPAPPAPPTTPTPAPVPSK